MLIDMADLSCEELMLVDKRDDSMSVLQIKGLSMDGLTANVCVKNSGSVRGECMSSPSTMWI